MNRKALFSLAMLATGLGLFAAAALADPASSASEKRGGVLRIESRSDFDHIDMAYAYFSHTWQSFGATQLRLYSFPDQEGAAGQRLVPEAAAGMPRVSGNGRVYTITVKRGFRFSNGANVTAANFARAILRILNVNPPSDAIPFLKEIVGAEAAIGKGRLPAGVRVRGNTLTLRLTRPVPDIVSRLTMPFFSATPLNWPINKEVTEAPTHTAGPYYMRQHENNRSATIVRNPFYKGPRRGMVDQIQYTFGNSLAAQRLKVERGEADLGGFPPAEAAELAQKYGINRGRFFLRPTSVVWYLAFNHDRPLFSGNRGMGNVRLKQAINHALDRPSLVRQYGYLAGKRTDQILPYSMPGFREWNIYSLKAANPNRARQLASGNTRGGKAVLYVFDTAPGPAVAQVVQFNLRQINVDVEIRTFERTVQHEKAATRGEPFDIVLEGWGQDYPDPSNFINVLLDGRRIQKANNQNVSYFNSTAFNRRMEAASRLAGPARLRAYGLLDRDLMRQAAPWAPVINSNARVFVSDRIARWRWQPANAHTNLVTTELK